jgi:hypothetical protein
VAQYADIVEIIAPAEAAQGSRVDITVRIKNTYLSAIGIMAGGAIEYGVSPWPGISFSEPGANVDGGSTYSFSGYFTMPDKKVTIHAYSYWYGADGAWYFDDEMTRSVDMAGVPSPSISEFRISDFAKV